VTRNGEQEATYITSVLTLYVDLPDTPWRPNPMDQSLARRFHQEEIPLSLIESALLLGTWRRLAPAEDLPPLPRIRSLAYFLPVIAELQMQPLPAGYLDYLRLKLRTLAKAARPDVPKSTFFDAR
jgi:hypothetical protein